MLTTLATTVSSTKIRINEAIDKLLKKETDNTVIQLIRYTFIGAVAFLADFGTLAFSTEYFEIHYLISVTFGFIIGSAVNYILSVLWVFNHKAVSHKLLEILLFIAIGLIGLGLNELCMWMLTAGAEIHYLVSKIITTIIVYLWNFSGRKYLLFNKHQ